MVMFRRARMGARYDLIQITLRLDPDRQDDQKQHEPDDGIENNGRDRPHQTCSSSTSAPLKSLGCRKITGLP